MKTAPEWGCFLQMCWYEIKTRGTPRFYVTRPAQLFGSDPARMNLLGLVFKMP